MIRRDPKHWFECLYPTLEKKEKEIFFKHPFEDIKCNQIGAIYYNDARYVSYDTRTGSVVREFEAWNGKGIRVVGSKLKVIWECYHNERLESGAHFLFANGNPLDLTKENLLTVNRIDVAVKKEAAKTKARFISSSVEHLVKLEDRYGKKGLDKDTLHDLLQLPNWLSCARKKWKGATPKAYAKKL